MGRRSSFERRRHDEYDTPYEAVLPVIPHLRQDGIKRFCEPCSGIGYLVDHLESLGLRCGFASDIKMGWDALKEMTPDWFARIEVDGIVTNPPWSRSVRVSLIEKFLECCPGPVWCLLDADCMHTKYMAKLMLACTDIVTVGRVRWIAGSLFTSKDSAAWFRFKRDNLQPTVFHGRQLDIVDVLKMEAA
jgi:hypothetical protein